MSRTDFEAIAHVLDANVADLALVLDFADMLAESNPRFNKAIFVAASTKGLRDSTARTVRMLDRAEGRV